MKYKWHKESGLIDESGKQILQILETSPKRIRNEYGKILADALNKLTEPEYCEWEDLSYTEIHDGKEYKYPVYNLPCKPEGIMHTPQGDYCPFCGKPIKVKE